MTKSFFDFAVKQKRLTREEENALIKKAQDGDIEARNRVIQSHLLLALKISSRYFLRNIIIDDVLQEIYIGFLEAINKYSPDRGTKFASLAAMYARHRVSVYISKNFSQLSTGTNYFRKEQNIKNPLRTVSFSSTFYPDEKSFEEVYIADNDSNDDFEMRDEIEYLMKPLSPRERGIVFERYWGRKTYREIGEELGITGSRVQMILMQAIKKMKSLGEYESRAVA